MDGVSAADVFKVCTVIRLIHQPTFDKLVQAWFAWMGIMASRRGKYRIQTVADMTGVSAATLRAWERRYGIPSPERSSSSYRLFSDRDVHGIRRLKQLCDNGMAPAEAARVVMGTEDASNAPVEPDPYLRACEAIVAAVEDFSPEATERAVRSAMFLGSASTVYQRVLAPTMIRVGDLWHDGTISIAQEHMATESLVAVARDMLRLLDTAHGAPPVLLACFADEDHVLPLYGVAFTLIRWGYQPVVLGARTPPSAIRHAVESIQPELVGLSVSVAPPAYRARELIKDYAEAVQSVPWIVGGSGSDQMQIMVEASGGIVVGTRPLEEVRLLVTGAAGSGATRAGTTGHARKG